MRFRSGALRLLGLAMVLACLAGETRAAMTTTQTNTIPLTTTDWGPGTFGPGVDPMLFNKFNPALGQLQSVNFTLAGAFQHDISMSFTTPATITVTASQNVINLTRPDTSALLSASVPDYSQTVTYGFNPGQTLPKTFTFPTSTTTPVSQSGTLTSAADLALFNGPGTIALPISASAFSKFSSSSGNGSGFAQTLASAVVTLSYTYSPVPVPEPSSMVLLGLGGGVMLIARRARRRSTSR